MQVHHSTLEAAFAGAAPIPAHARPGHHIIQELPTVLGTVPESLYHQVHAPFTMALPGSKVKPSPHNLAQLAASPRVLAAAAAAQHAHALRKMHAHSKHSSPTHAQQPMHRQRTDMELLVSGVPCSMHLPCMALHVLVSSLPTACCHCSTCCCVMCISCGVAVHHP